jgi:hypothetical protein
MVIETFIGHKAHASSITFASHDASQQFTDSLA